MSDITKCTDAACPSRKHCYRHTAPSTAGNQSYADFARDEGAEKCEAYCPDDNAIKRLREIRRILK